MLNSLLDLGLNSIIKLNAGLDAQISKKTSVRTHQSLKSYPSLLLALTAAEQSGRLATERRRLAIHRATR